VLSSSFESAAVARRGRAGSAALLIAALATLAAPLRGASESPAAAAALPSLAELEREGYHVGEVRLDLGDVFDLSAPGENKPLFRLANRLHRRTRPEVVRRLLLFSPGDRISAERLAESERLLRQARIFYDARIRPVRIADGAVDLEVETRDVWSLTASVGFRRSGGANTKRVELEDTNFLGYGKQLQALVESNVDRDFGQLLYRDRNVLGSHARLEFELATASDGRRRWIATGRPFYALDTRWAVFVEAVDETRDDTLYDLGHVVDRFGRHERALDAYAGWSPGLRGRLVDRFEVGWTTLDLRFAEPKTGVDPDPGPVPANRRLRYPWIGWGRVVDGFEVTHDLDKIERSEDLNLGARVGVRLGYSSRGLGSSEDALVLFAGFRDGFRVGRRQLWLVGADLEGRYGSGEARGVLASLAVRDYIRDGENARLLLSLRYDFSHALEADRQLIVGGDNGLRGYPLRFQPGERIALTTIEQRWYHDREYFHLFRIGAAAFADAARIWGDGVDAARRPYRQLRDIGIGLRISSSRSARASMVHLDLAYPLDGPQGIARLQWLVTTSETF